MVEKIKIALRIPRDPLVRMIATRIGVGTAVGAGAGGFAGHRLEKRKAERPDFLGKPRKVTTLGNTLRGAYAGGLIGLTNAVYGGHLDRDTLKQAKSSWRAAGHPFKERHEELIGAGVGGSALGGLGYLVGKHGEKAKDPKRRGDRWAGLAAGAAMGAGYGHMFGNMARLTRVVDHQSHVGSAGHRTDASGNFDFGNSKTEVKTPDWAKGAKTKAEAKKAYRAQATKHHPDHGGNAETMKKVNTEWEAFEKSPHFQKLAFVLQSFMDELQKISTKLPHPLVAPPPHLMPQIRPLRTPVRGKMLMMDSELGQSPPIV